MNDPDQHGSPEHPAPWPPESPGRRWAVGPEAESAARELAPGDEVKVVNESGGWLVVDVRRGWRDRPAGPELAGRLHRVRLIRELAAAREELEALRESSVRDRETIDHIRREWGETIQVRDGFAGEIWRLTSERDTAIAERDALMRLLYRPFGSDKFAIAWDERLPVGRVTWTEAEAVAAIRGAAGLNTDD
jgi:hypothetical protein